MAKRNKKQAKVEITLHIINLDGVKFGDTARAMVIGKDIDYHSIASFLMKNMFRSLQLISANLYKKECGDDKDIHLGLVMQVLPEKLNKKNNKEK
jgi:hypothetical protein